MCVCVRDSLTRKLMIYLFYYIDNFGALIYAIFREHEAELAFRMIWYTSCICTDRRHAPSNEPKAPANESN